VTEMMTYDWSMITAYILMCFNVSTNYEFTIYIAFQQCLFSAPEIFTLDAYGTKTGSRKRSRFMVPISEAYVIGIGVVSIDVLYRRLENSSGVWTRQDSGWRRWRITSRVWNRGWMRMRENYVG